ncbi:MAG: TonB-dependent receptor [candidate division WOR-3 bacterium]
MSMIYLIYMLLSGATFQGRVVDAITKQPIPYVQIQLTSPGWETAISTDSLGRFVLKAPIIPEQVMIRASRVGYKSGIWKDVSIKDTVTLYLFPRSIPVAGATTTASRLKAKAESAYPVTVIENKPLFNRGQTDISGFVGTAPSVMIQDYGNLTTLSLRGATAEQTLILLDGVRLNSSLNNQADITLIAPFLAQKVEVARGGGSALYGANAIGGVINILTPQIEKFQAKANLGTGSFGRRYASFTILSPGRIDYFLTGGLTGAKNTFPYKVGDSIRIRENADLTRGDLLLKTGARIGPHYFSCLGGFTAGNRGSPGPVTFPSDSARLNDIRFLTVLGYDIFESAKARLQVRLSHQRLYQNYYNPGPYFTANDTHQIHQTGVTVNQSLEPSTYLKGNIGYESYYEQAKSTTVTTPFRWTNSLFFETEAKWKGISVNPALRYDFLQNGKKSSFGSQRDRIYGAFSPKLALNLTPLSFFSIFFSLNRSFRVPTFNELYWPEDPWSKGNLALHPEWATGVEAGVGGFIGEAGLWRLNLFNSSFTNLIQWQEVSPYFYQPVNVARAKINGIEMEGKISSRLAGFSGNLTYQISRSEDKDLAYRPRLSGQGSLWFSFSSDDTIPISRLMFTGKGVSSRYTNPESSDTLPGYTILDIEFMVNVPEIIGGLFNREKTDFNGWLILGCRNFLNRQYQIVKDYPIMGRNIYLEIDTGW